MTTALVAHPVRLFTKKAATEITAGVSQTEKMPCVSWSIPVFMCQRGSVLAKVPGSVCFHCYADRGNYNKYRINIEPAQVARWDAFEADPLLWIDAMQALITGPEFRWFDAGDLQSLLMLECIVILAQRTPDTMHWLPSKEYEMVAAFVAKHGPDSIPANLNIRLSAFMIDGRAKLPAILRGVRGITTSEVHSGEPRDDVFVCGAPTRGGKCGPCRTCWSADVPTVSYHQH